MSQRIFIASTPLDRLRPLSWQGVQAISCYDQFSRILQKKLSPAHFAMLAEPFLDSQALAADWYAWLPDDAPHAQPVKLVKLPPDLQAQMREYMITLGRPVFDLAQELKHSADSNSSTAGNLLEMALTFPGEEYIYILGNQPVLIGWGYAPDQLDTAPEQLTRLRAAPLIPVAETTKNEGRPVAANAETAAADVTGNLTHSEETVREKSTLPWAVIAFLIGALIAGLLLYWFRPETFNFGGACSRIIPAGNATAEGPSYLRQNILRAQGQEEVLRDELDRLRKEYHFRLLKCQEEPENQPLAQAPETTPPPPTPVPEEEIVPPVPQLAMPELPPDPPPAPKPKPKPAPEVTPYVAPEPAPKPKSGHLEIPDNPTGLAFLEGCWEAEIPQGTPGRYASTPQRLVYCFDDSGNGSGVLSNRITGEKICVGGATGELKGNSLRIKDKPPLRPRSCIAETITCKNASSGVAECSSVFEDGGTSKLVFRRR